MTATIHGMIRPMFPTSPAPAKIWKRFTTSRNELLKLGRGAVVELDRKVGEAIDIYVNDRLVARGEVVVVDDRLGITMTEIIKTQKA